VRTDPAGGAWARLRPDTAWTPPPGEGAEGDHGAADAPGDADNIDVAGLPTTHGAADAPGDAAQRLGRALSCSGMRK
jgi:hypothetical protein